MCYQVHFGTGGASLTPPARLALPLAAPARTVLLAATSPVQSHFLPAFVAGPLGRRPGCQCWRSL